MISTAQAEVITGGAVAENEFTAEELTPEFVAMLDDLAKRIPDDFIFDGMIAEADLLRADIARTIYDSAKDPKGALAGSFEVQVLNQGADSISIGVFSDLVYAEIQDEGGEIKAKAPLKYLAYPHKDAKSIIGIRWPRDFAKGELQFIKSKKPGTALLYQGNRLMFILKERVELPGLRYLDKARTLWESNLDKNLGGHIGVSFTRAGFE